MKRRRTVLAPIFRPRKATQVLLETTEYNLTEQDRVVAIYYDLETTGFKAEEDHITQIGACCPIPGQQTRTYTSYVSTDREIPEKVTQLTGITSELLFEKGLPLETVLEQFFAFIDDCRQETASRFAALVSYNGQRFDDVFLRVACRYGNRTLEERARRAGLLNLVDALPWCKRMLPSHRLVRNDFNRASYRLGDVYTCLFSGETFEAHRADADTLALARICDHKAFNVKSESYYCRRVHEQSFKAPTLPDPKTTADLPQHHNLFEFMMQAARSS